MDQSYNISDLEKSVIREQLSRDNIAASAQRLAPLSDDTKHVLDLLADKFKGDLDGKTDSGKLKVIVALKEELKKLDDKKNSSSTRTKVSGSKAKFQNLNKVCHLPTYLIFI